MKFIAFGLGTAVSKRAAAIAIRLNIPVACPVGPCAALPIRAACGHGRNPGLTAMNAMSEEDPFAVFKNSSPLHAAIVTPGGELIIAVPVSDDEEALM